MLSKIKTSNMSQHIPEEVIRNISAYHAVVWLDHDEAHVMHFSLNEDHEKHASPINLHQKSRVKSGKSNYGTADEDQFYFHNVAQTLKPARRVTVVGPCSAKLKFIKHIKAHDKDCAHKIIAVETVDHPSDVEIVDMGRKYFVSEDNMLFQTAVNL